MIESNSYPISGPQTLSLAQLMGIGKEPLELTRLIACLSRFTPNSFVNLRVMAEKIGQVYKELEPSQLKGINQLINNLILKQFPRPTTDALRELITNACESEIRAGREDSVNVTIHNNKFRIKDQGEGIGCLVTYLVPGRSSNPRAIFNLEEGIPNVSGRFGQGCLSMFFFLLYQTQGSSAGDPQFVEYDKRISLRVVFKYEEICHEAIFSCQEGEDVSVEVHPLPTSPLRKISVETHRKQGEFQDTLKIKFFEQEGRIWLDIYEKEPSQFTGTKISITSPLIEQSAKKIEDSIHHTFALVSSPPILVNQTPVDQSAHFKALQVDLGTVFYYPQASYTRKGTLEIREQGKLIWEISTEGLVPEVMAIDFKQLSLTHERASVNFKDIDTGLLIRKVYYTIFDHSEMSLLEKSMLLNGLYPLLESHRFNLMEEMQNIVGTRRDPVWPDTPELQILNLDAFFLNPKYIPQMNQDPLVDSRYYEIFLFDNPPQLPIIAVKADKKWILLLDRSLYDFESPTTTFFNFYLLNEWLKQKNYPIQIKLSEISNLLEMAPSNHSMAESFSDTSPSTSLVEWQQFESAEDANQELMLGDVQDHVINYFSKKPEMHQQLKQVFSSGRISPQLGIKIGLISDGSLGFKEQDLIAIGQFFNLDIRHVILINCFRNTVFLDKILKKKFLFISYNIRKNPYLINIFNVTTAKYLFCQENDLNTISDILQHLLLHMNKNPNDNQLYLWFILRNSASLSKNKNKRKEFINELDRQYCQIHQIIQYADLKGDFEKMEIWKYHNSIEFDEEEMINIKQLFSLIKSHDLRWKLCNNLYHYKDICYLLDLHKSFPNDFDQLIEFLGDFTYLQSDYEDNLYLIKQINGSLSRVKLFICLFNNLKKVVESDLESFFYLIQFNKREVLGLIIYYANERSDFSDEHWIFDLHKSNFIKLFSASVCDKLINFYRYIKIVAISNDVEFLKEEFLKNKVEANGKNASLVEAIKEYVDLDEHMEFVKHNPTKKNISDLQEVYLSLFLKHELLVDKELRELIMSALMGEQSAYLSEDYAFPNRIGGTYPLQQDPDVFAEIPEEGLAAIRIQSAMKQSAKEGTYLTEAVKNSMEAGAKKIDIEVHRDSLGNLVLVIKDNGHGMGAEEIAALKTPGKTTKMKSDDPLDPNYGWGFFSCFTKFDEVFVQTSNGQKGSKLLFQKTREGLTLQSSTLEGEAEAGTTLILKMRTRNPLIDLIKIKAQVLGSFSYLTEVDISFQNRPVVTNVQRTQFATYTSPLIENGVETGQVTASIGLSEGGVYRNHLRIDDIDPRYLSHIPKRLQDILREDHMQLSVQLPKVEQVMTRNALIELSSTLHTIQRTFMLASFSYLLNKWSQGQNLDLLSDNYWLEFNQTEQVPPYLVEQLIEAINSGEWDAFLKQQSSEPHGKILRTLKAYFQENYQNDKLQFPYQRPSINLDQFLALAQSSYAERAQSQLWNQLKETLNQSRTLTQLLIHLPLQTGGISFWTLRQHLISKLKEKGILLANGAFNKTLKDYSIISDLLSTCLKELNQELDLKNKYDLLLTKFSTSILNAFSTFSIFESQQLISSNEGEASSEASESLLSHFLTKVARNLLGREVNVEFYQSIDKKIAYTVRGQNTLWINTLSPQFTSLLVLLEGDVENLSDKQVQVIVDWLKTLAHEITHQKESSDCNNIHDTHDPEFRQQMSELMYPLFIKDPTQVHCLNLLAEAQELSRGKKRKQVGQKVPEAKRQRIG